MKDLVSGNGLDYDSDLDGTDTTWPGLADTLLATVFVLVLVLAAVVGLQSAANSVKLDTFQRQQSYTARRLADELGSAPDSVKGGFRIAIDSQYRDSVSVQRDLVRLRFSFGSQTLFPVDSYELRPTGRGVLEKLGIVLLDGLEKDNIREIQIEGHADTDPTKAYPSNTELAALRAIQVFHVFEETGIDPAKYLVSVASFGEYVPANRSRKGHRFGQDSLYVANRDTESKARNRRIEVVVTYTGITSDSTSQSTGKVELEK